MSEQKITIQNGKLQVPDNPVIPFIEGDGTGIDIWPASKLVFDNAVAKAYNGLEKAIESKRVTYDFERLMDGATLLKCSEFGQEIVNNM